MIDDNEWLALRDKLTSSKPDTFVRVELIDVVEIKLRRRGYIKVHLYLEHQEVEGWVPETTIVL